LPLKQHGGALGVLLLAWCAGAPGLALAEAPRVVAGVELTPILQRLTLEQKVGQLLILGFGGMEMDERAEKLLRDKKPGGVALFSRNIGPRAQVRALTTDVQRVFAREIPPFIAVDQEGGNVIRLKERTTLLPSAMALGAARSTALAEASGRAVGADLRLLGFNMNFAPVLDVNSNPANPVIGVRSFGESPELVAEMGSAFVAGLRAAGVAAVAKHFPGHGDTLSSAVNMGLLRREMGFEGIIMTDGLEMEAVAARYGAGKAAVSAVKAGADMVMVLWFPERKTEVHRALLEAARSGDISRERLDDAVLRVLGEKARLGLLGPVPPPPPSPGMSTLGIDNQVAAASVTMLKNEGDVLPLVGGQRVLVVSPDRTFAAAMRQRLPDVRTVMLPSTATHERQRAVLKQAVKMGRDVDVVVVAAINDVQLKAARALLEDRPGRPVVLVSFLSPYMVSQLPDVDAYLCTYSYLRPSQVAAARVLTGHAQARGRLPVTIPNMHAFGDGIVPPRAAAVGP
jgi:beta-N-acetylhexosaminidase